MRYKGFVECHPPLVVTVNGQRREWDILLHTCDLQGITPCLACGYLACPAKHPQHFAPAGCPACSKG